MNQISTVYIVDDDEAIRKSLSMLMKSMDIQSKSYASAEEFLAGFSPTERSCILLDVRMPGLSGLELQALLPKYNIHLPVIMMTGYGDVGTAVKAMKAGAVDFIEKPFDHDLLMNIIHKSIRIRPAQLNTTEKQKFIHKLDLLTKRELEVFDYLVDGKMNKVIAAELDLSVRTVEAHRANLMAKLEAHSLSDLVKISIYAQLTETI